MIEEMIMVSLLVLFGFFLGVIVVVAAEFLGFLWILKRLRRKINSDKAKFSSIRNQLDRSSSCSSQIDSHQSFKKEGVVWVLEPEKVSKYFVERSSKEVKRKKELFEVSPVRKYGNIKCQSLVLTEPDGSHTTIQLKGCIVEAVSATSAPTKKWAKKYPIKVENRTSVIYHGSKTLYVYLETSSEKEAWCKALRLASCDEREKLQWYSQLQEEFHSYLTSLNTEYHSFMKPTVGLSVDAIERATKTDGSSSKVRQFLKKITRKSSRVGLDNKWTSFSGHEDKKKTEKLRACQDAVLATSYMKNAAATSLPRSSISEDAPSLSSSLSRSGSQSHFSVCSDSDEKFGIDEGTLCWNLLISRLFFDIKGNEQVKKSVQERIQRTLSNMRTPAYVGDVVCTDINMGNVPPCIIGMRVLPMEMSEVCALEVDIEYSGSAILEIETRLEVGELEKEGSNPESNNVGSVPSDIIQDFENLDKQLGLAEGMNDLQEPKEDGDWNNDVSKKLRSNTPSTTHGSRWKSMLNSVAKHVSQVPISLAIRVASLRGTLRFFIKPPPADQLWYGFTFMPDIDFNLESSVGEHKINNTHIALFLINRLKAAIRDTLVLPNSESVGIRWMLAEKDDWVPRNVAPFIWINQESGNEISNPIDTNNQTSGGVKASAKTSGDSPEPKLQKLFSSESRQDPARKSDSQAFPSSFSFSAAIRNSKSFDELSKPLLESGQQQETTDLKDLSMPSLESDHEASEEKTDDVSVSSSPSNSAVMDRSISSAQQDDDSMPKKIGRRERFLDFRKKMSEKVGGQKKLEEVKGFLLRR
ncbi:hypothetical protein MtrunA17_Chr6g0477861 [Medicago truncatula]|uniref:SMP-LTD domain-containing protein n=1 Tax=Medicago truncatula TaxID=3880 RepID=A0A396HHW7_MEDTR|nr:uncharacterized protein LOC25496616 [Medicago truncatula]RHN52198.1 hypothetical protein MtrunA17_Chr6g0477861 [Medicago truncatula]